MPVTYVCVRRVAQLYEFVCAPCVIVIFIVVYFAAVVLLMCEICADYVVVSVVYKLGMSSGKEAYVIAVKT